MQADAVSVGEGLAEISPCHITLQSTPTAPSGVYQGSQRSCGGRSAMSRAARCRDERPVMIHETRFPSRWHLETTTCVIVQAHRGQLHHLRGGAFRSARDGKIDWWFERGVERVRFSGAVRMTGRIRLEQRPAPKGQRERRWPHKPLATTSEKERSTRSSASSFRLMRPQRK